MVLVVLCVWWLLYKRCVPEYEYDVCSVVKILRGSGSQSPRLVRKQNTRKN